MLIVLEKNRNKDRVVLLDNDDHSIETIKYSELCKACDKYNIDVYDKSWLNIHNFRYDSNSKDIIVYPPSADIKTEVTALKVHLVGNLTITSVPSRTIITNSCDLIDIFYKSHNSAISVLLAIYFYLFCERRFGKGILYDMLQDLYRGRTNQEVENVWTNNTIKTLRNSLNMLLQDDYFEVYDNDIIIVTKVINDLNYTNKSNISFPNCKYNNKTDFFEIQDCNYFKTTKGYRFTVCSEETYIDTLDIVPGSEFSITRRKYACYIKNIICRDSYNFGILSKYLVDSSQIIVDPKVFLSGKYNINKFWNLRFLDTSDKLILSSLQYSINKDILSNRHNFDNLSDTISFNTCVKSRYAILLDYCKYLDSYFTKNGIDSNITNNVQERIRQIRNKKIKL